MRLRPWANSDFVVIRENPPINYSGNKIKPRTHQGTQSSMQETEEFLYMDFACRPYLS